MEEYTINLYAANSTYQKQNSFNEYVCKPLIERANKFCSPEKMLEYQNSLHSQIADANTIKMQKKFLKSKEQNKVVIDSIENCMENKFDDTSYLLVRKLKEDSSKSILSLFNTNSGKLKDVPSPFDTEFGDISKQLQVFIKKACNYAHEIQKSI